MKGIRHPDPYTISLARSRPWYPLSRHARRAGPPLRRQGREVTESTFTTSICDKSTHNTTMFWPHARRGPGTRRARQGATQRGRAVVAAPGCGRGRLVR